MKKIINSILALLLILLVFSCDNGIDSITAVDPGPDAGAPVISITSPTEGLTLKVNEVFASVDIKFEAADDIELKSVAVSIDNVQLNNFDSFIDYRRLVVDNLIYDQIADGDHELKVVATDISDKTTIETINFTKEPAYIPKYPNEILYIAFDGDYTDLVSLEKAAVEGTPGFNDDNLNGASSYMGAQESYLTFPADRFKNNEFSAIFWMKVNDAPNKNGVKRAGVVTLRSPMVDGKHDLKKGFTFFREDVAGNQRFKLNVGSGEKNHWFDGNTAADVDPTADKWVNFAFTIAGNEATVYIDGQVVKTGPHDGIDWTDCNILSIMSGAPNFTQWNHWSDQSLLDEFRIFDRAISQQEILQIMADDSGEFVSGYTPTYAGEMFYMPFDGNYNELFRDLEAAKVGTPGFAGESVEGTDAYAGATDSYLTFPTDERGALTTNEFSATCWYKVNNDPNRAGILAMRSPMTDGGTKNDLTKGFSFFREDAGGMQRFKLNVGLGSANQWVDGGATADVDPSVDKWIHLAFTIASDKATVYIDGEVVAENALASPVDWTGVDILSVMSGAPNFTQWNHWSDLSLMDELRLYDKALSQSEIQTIMGN
ncbi:LamG-like jellyroll fold domain-containing protein [Flavivirga abyssicola]|uniref:LamG-like jellyroll fold domain-containing protein n=1 Tax=Flavivirga abyssicola TaxID=3063533 RepID=UPI0026E10DC9|nr:LamG-like jellyroll fold domain-containing protein [Flavivirga sp. MEBiC07777]WVK14167.1 LamG-like jellyroll fold domain-containing protein [Flavivirga sp. MEBiC07777]